MSTSTHPVSATEPVAGPAPRVVIELPAERVAPHPDNIRDPGRDLKALTASVREVGVLVPLIVVPVAAVPGHEFDPGVTHVAVDGSRRQAAARAAGLPLPCEVRADLATARDTAVTMAATGLVRDGLTAREEAGAVQTMLNLGVSVTAVGRATGRSRAHIATARKAATLTADLAAAGDYPLTLEQLAILAEHQDDPDAVAALLAAAPRGHMPHVVAGLEIDRRERELHAATVATLTAAGVIVTDTEPRGHIAGGPRSLANLRNPDTPPGDCLTPEQHAACPGHVAHVEVTIYEPDDVDGEDTDVRITYGCTDPEAHGHAALYGRMIGPADPVAGGADEQAHADREAREARDKRDARRELIRLNKDADAAQAVRREFLRHCLAARSRHKAMTGWALRQVLGRDRGFARWIGEWNPPTVLGELLGCEPGDAVDVSVTAPPVRHSVMLWAYVVAAVESEFVRDAHRQADAHRAGYLRHLASLGHALSDVERRVVDNAATGQPGPVDDTAEAGTPQPSRNAGDPVTAPAADAAGRGVPADVA